MRNWLEDTEWSMRVEINRQLCDKAGCLHKINTASGKKTEELWEASRTKKTSLKEMVLFCKRIHFKEPFVNMNGNTLAAVAIDAASGLLPEICTKEELEEAICAVIAGTVQGREEIVLLRESDHLDPPKKAGPEMA